MFRDAAPLLPLRTGGALSFYPGRVCRLLGYLVGQILVLFGLVEQLFFVLVGNDFGAVTQQDDPTRTDTEPARSLHLQVVVIGVILKLILDPGAAEFGCTT